MLIAFTHPFKAFLPEIEAYRQFFEKHGIKTTVVHPDDNALQRADVEWRFMGLQFRRSRTPVLIHEYASASLPPRRNTKDFIKSRFTVKPDFRLFLNEYVRDRLSFNDTVPYGLRDMGVDGILLTENLSQKKLYDFIYVGSVTREMNMHRLLDRFTLSPLREKTILVLSKDYTALQRRYSAFPNIIFKGPVQQQEVRQFISQASFAINYKPDIAPHNEQTSTKFLEYAACQVPVISSDFAWMRHFQQQYGGDYYYLQPDLSNLQWEPLNNFRYSFPDLGEWTWEKQIARSGVLEFLRLNRVDRA